MELARREMRALPLMAERSASIQSCCNRQWLTGRWEERVAPGGKGRQPVAKIVDEYGSQDLCVKVAAGKSRVLCPQSVEIEEGLEAFESDFDLPSKAVEFEHVQRAELL